LRFIYGFSFINNSCDEAILIYSMITNRIPKVCLDEIERLQRNFIWGDTDYVKKYRAMSWDMMLGLNVWEVLGLRKLDVVNQAWTEPLFRCQ
jgi:hypothetical protein